jgi:hypothetical protein
VLLHCFLVRLLVESAYSGNPTPTLTDSPDALAERLRDRQPLVFDAAGNRLPGMGEYVVALLPRIDAAQGGSEVLSSAMLEVWRRETAGSKQQTAGSKAVDPSSLPAAGRLLPVAEWRLIKSLVTDHARRPESVP